MSETESVGVSPPQGYLAARVFKQPITVRATWRAGERECDLLLGKSNVLVDRELPAFHSFQWSAVEVLHVYVGKSFLERADFQFFFGKDKAYDFPLPLCLNRRHEVGLRLEEAGMTQPKPQLAIPPLDVLTKAMSEEPDGDEWKSGQSPEDEDEDDGDDGEDVSEARQKFIASMMEAAGSMFSAPDVRQYQPVRVLAHELIKAKLVSEEPAPCNIDLIFVMHGVLARPYAQEGTE